jgi:hypothetical protein
MKSVNLQRIHPRLTNHIVTKTVGPISVKSCLKSKGKKAMGRKVLVKRRVNQRSQKKKNKKTKRLVLSSTASRILLNKF